MNIFGYITIISAVLAIILILIQTRGAGLGAGLGGGGSEMNTTRRGSDQSIHLLTIITVLVFGLSLIMGILV